MPAKRSREGFTEEERAAMRERVKELRRPAPGQVDGEHAVLEAIAALPEPSRRLATRLHAVIRASAPALVPRTWYGMPAYSKDGEVVCFFRPKEKFKERYLTIGFNDAAHLDEGHLWPVAFALTELSATDESKIAELVRRAAA